MEKTGAIFDNTMSIIKDNGSKMLNEVFDMITFSEATNEVTSLGDYLTYFFEEMESLSLGSCRKMKDVYC